MNSIERRNEILEVLSIKRASTLTYFSERFGVSKNTVISDIEILSLKYPIYTVQGNNGGIFVADDWKYRPQYLNQKQIDMLNKFKDNPRCSQEDKKLLEAIINDFSAPWIDQEAEI